MKQLAVMILVVLVLYTIILNTTMLFVEDSLVIDERVEVISNEDGVCYMTYKANRLVYFEICDIDGNELASEWYSMDDGRFI